MPVTDQAFVTLGTNDAYCHGALVLGQSLRNHRTSRMLAILITPQVSRAMRAVLSNVFDAVVDVDEIDSKDVLCLALLNRPELGVTFTKLHCWTLTQYNKCVFMDADTLVLCNVDELFDREELSAAPDSGWPDCFNSGVFVFRPSLKTFNLLLQFANEHGSFDGGDQGLLNRFFSNWATTDISKHLPFLYNLSSNAIYTYAPAFRYFGKDAKVVHFLGSAKPWNCKYNPQTRTIVDDGSASVSQSQRSFLELWWETYNSSILPLLEKLQESYEPELPKEELNLSENQIELEEEEAVLSSNSLPISVNTEYVIETTVGTCNELSANNSVQKVEGSHDVKVAVPSQSSTVPIVQTFPQHTIEMVGGTLYSGTCGSEKLQEEVTSSVSELSTEPGPQEPSAEDERRKWEEGHIDYLGKDAFENIQKKLDSFLL
ncbi:glycogenin-2 isoform X2 [Eublepharis macularius]|uniref:glycogenin glucosyltransferase n=1 Tax=Eublepharis macularius TaxID=481883 RepID=A0AA97J2C9_EUBMA|nr:glycogenin-2 isoform X2 [Eublepharis macularius]